MREPAERSLAVFLALLAAALCTAGCTRWPLTSTGLENPAPSTTESHDRDRPGAERFASEDRAVLAADHWVLRTQRRDERDARWCHAALEDLLARPPERRPDVAAMLADAIALARLGDGRGAAALADAVRHPRTSLPSRRAAAEALAELPADDALPPLAELIEQYGGSSPGRASYVPEIHVELVRALARHADAADDPRFAEALASPSRSEEHTSELQSHC